MAATKFCDYNSEQTDTVPVLMGFTVLLGNCILNKFSEKYSVTNW